MTLIRFKYNATIVVNSFTIFLIFRTAYLDAGTLEFTTEVDVLVDGFVFLSLAIV